MTSTARWGRLSWLKAVTAFVVIASASVAAQHGLLPRQEPQTSSRAVAPNLPPRNAFLHEAFAPLPEPEKGFVLEAPNLTTKLIRGRVVHYEGLSAVTVDFEGARPVFPEPAITSETRVNYLLGGDESRWRVGVPTYGAVRYRGLYPGVDMLYRGRDGLKSEFDLAPGADPSQIRMRFGGAVRVALSDSTTLSIKTLQGELRDENLMVIQRVGGRERQIEASFVLHGDGAVGFWIGEYDHSLPLLIDPSIAYSSFLGSTRIDNATSIAVGSDGSAYVAGWTESNSFPVIAAFRGYSGGVDGFVAKVSPAGVVEWATYLGGAGEDRLSGVGVGPSGAVYVVGYSTSADFPVLAALQSTKRGTRDAVIAKILANGTGLVYSTYYGGTGIDTANAIAVDPFEQAYVVGETDSSNFPTRFPLQASRAGLRDAWLLKINLFNNLSYATYLGGSGDDRAMAIALSPSLTPYIAGCTTSTNLPLANASQPNSGGGQDAFVARFQPDADGLIYSTYLGGSGGTLGQAECAYALAVDPFGNAYVGGVTSSRNFPLLTPFHASYRGGTTDGFVTKLNSGGERLYSTYLGGNNTDWITAIRVDSLRRPLVAGYTASTNFPTVASIQSAHGGIYDTFVTRFDYPGSSLNFSTFLGGSVNDVAYGMDLSATGDVYLTGITSSPNYPLLNQFQSALAGSVDAFVTKLTGF